MYENIGYKTALHEIEASFLRQLDGIGKTKNTARTIFQSASLIVALLSSLQIMTNEFQTDLVWIFRTGLIVSFLLYIGLIILSIMAMNPVNTHSPFPASWEILCKSFLEKDEKSILEQQLSNYLDAMEQNGKICKTINNRTIWAGRLMGAMVSILLLLSLLPKA